MKPEKPIKSENAFEVQPQIPVFVRALFYSAFRISPLKEVGKSVYQFAARRIGYALADKAKGLSVYLFGGTIDRCIPAISDLDFLLLKQKKFTKDELWELRGTYLSLKRRFPLLGEVHLSQKSSWRLLENSGSAVQLWFANKQKFRNGKYEKLGRQKTSCYSKYSRLALCIHHYQKAQKYLLSSFHNKSISQVYLAHFTREISKALSWTEGDTVKIEKTLSPAFLLAKALFQIHALARTLAFSAPFPSSEKIRLTHEKTQVQQFLTTVTNREHLAKLHQFSDELSLLKNSEIPLVLSLKDNLSFSTALRIMNSYVCYLEKAVVEEVHFPLLLTEKLETFSSFGWNWGEALSHLSWVTPYHLEDPDWMFNLKGHTEQRLRERILLNLNVIRGKLICGRPETIFRELTILAREVLWLGTGNLENRDRSLTKLGKNIFPISSQILQLKVDKAAPMSLGDLFDLCLELCSETEGLMSKRE